MEATLIINGQIADLELFISRIIEHTLEKSQGQKIQFTPEFEINPDMAYRLDDERIQKLFGVQSYKLPKQAILSALRANGISPITAGRNGSKVFGSQVLEYMQVLKSKQTSFSHKN